MNYADPRYWIQKTNLPELVRDDAIRTSVELKETKRLVDTFQLLKNLRYVQAVMYKHNGDMLKEIIEHIETWSSAHKIALADVRLVSPAYWAQDAIVLEFIDDPESYDAD